MCFSRLHLPFIVNTTITITVIGINDIFIHSFIHSFFFTCPICHKENSVPVQISKIFFELFFKSSFPIGIEEDDFTKTKPKENKY
jgi:hypothetical protein